MTSPHPIFDYPVTIRERHLDSFGHVNNAAYLTLFEEARWELITRRGFGLERVQETGLGPTILGVTLRFKRELRLRADIVIRTQLDHYRSKLGVINQWMTNAAGGDGSVYCEASFTFGLFDLKARKLVAPSDEWRRALGG